MGVADAKEETADDAEAVINKLRKQMLEQGVAPVQIPDSDSLQSDACAPGYHYNTNSYLLIESKEHMRDVRKVRSPDEWDAVALTFAEPVDSGAGFGRKLDYKPMAGW